MTNDNIIYWLIIGQSTSNCQKNTVALVLSNFLRVHHASQLGDFTINDCVPSILLYLDRYIRLLRHLSCVQLYTRLQHVGQQSIFKFVFGILINSKQRRLWPLEQ